MKFFKRKPSISFSTHTAVLYIQNDHLNVEQAIDLSHFDFDELQEIISYIEFKTDMQEVEDPADFEGIGAYYRGDPDATDADE